MINLKNKLILEDLEDNETLEIEPHMIEGTVEGPSPDLTPEEETNFHFSSVSDILNRDLELYNLIGSIKVDSALNPDVHNVLESVQEDLAVSIGKLQECLKLCSETKVEDLIVQGEDSVKDSSIDEE